jgi:GNAT superfamily N-acetyltransferase
MGRSEEFEKGKSKLTVGYSRGKFAGIDRHVLIAYDNGFPVAQMKWMAEAPFRVQEIAVNESHQRKGIATALWNHAKTITPEIQHSEARTPDGDAWVASLDKNQK